MAKIHINDAVFEDYKKTAVQWNKTLLDLPLRSADDVLKHMRGITGLRGKMMLGEVGANSQFGPFKKTRKGDATVDIKYRELETFHGNVVEEFAPVDYAHLTMGYNDPILGDKIKGATTTALVLMELAKARGQHIAQAVLTGVRKADGDNTTDLCDGFVTIAKKEIAAGNIAKDKKNYVKLSGALTYENTCDKFKEEILRGMDDFLKAEQSIVICAPEIVDMYNESYLASHPSVVYNAQYEQPYVEGSHKRLTLVGLPEMAGQKHMIITQKDNLIWAVDNKSDESFVDIMRKDHYTLSFASDIYFGCQFRTIDARRLCIVELADAPATDAQA